MYLMPSDIEKFEDDEILDLFLEVFPEGEDMFNIFKTKIDPELFHWIRENFSLSTEEELAYCQACDIINSNGYWYSENILDSSRVVDSHDIKHSSGIFFSSEIDNAMDVVDSEYVEQSEQIFHSLMIENSKRVANSKNVVNSTNIVGSNGITNCINIKDTSGAFNCSELVKCTAANDSHFCSNSSNIKHCLFCNGISNEEYCIFNQKVDKDWYEQFIRQYKKYGDFALAFVRDWPFELVFDAQVFIIEKIDEWYSLVPEKFWCWAKTLPGYDGQTLYEMTFLPNFILLD